MLFKKKDTQNPFFVEAERRNEERSKDMDRLFDLLRRAKEATNICDKTYKLYKEELIELQRLHIKMEQTLYKK